MSGEKSPLARATSYQPGQSGNPGGKPATAEISRLARRYTVDAIRALVDVARLPAHSHAAPKTAAARALIDIGFPGLSKGASQGAEGNAVHLHLLAIQALAESPAGHPAPIEPMTGENIEGEGWVESAGELLPEPDDGLPDEALPLWDAYKARRAARMARDAEFTIENTTETPDSAAESADSDPRPAFEGEDSTP